MVLCEADWSLPTVSVWYVIELYRGGVWCFTQLALGGTELCIHVSDCFSVVNQRPDLGPAVHCESSGTGHDCRSPGGGIDGFRFAASRRVSLPFRDGCLNKESFCISLGLFSVWIFWEFYCSFHPQKNKILKKPVWFFGLENLSLWSLELYLCILLELNSPRVNW